MDSRIMGSDVLVTVIVPMYNQERYIDSCIRSICDQTYKNLEILIINDGSVDKSPLMAQKWTEKDSRVRLINKKNEGTSYARRDGYLQSKGDFITFVDNDDKLPPDAIEIMVRHMVEKDVDLVYGSVTRFFGWLKQNKPFGSFPVDEVVTAPRLFDEYYLGFFRNTIFPVSVWGRLFRKSIVDKAYQDTELFSPEMPCMAGDEYFNLKLFPYLRSMYRTDEAVYYYRYGGTVDHFNRFFPEVFTLSDLRLKLLDQFNYDKGYKPLFEEYISMVYYHAGQFIEFNQGDKDDVIDFFKQELGSREIVPRLTQYFRQTEVKDDAHLLLMNHDYEGMYRYAHQLVTERLHSLRYRTKRAALYLYEKLH